MTNINFVKKEITTNNSLQPIDKKNIYQYFNNNKAAKLVLLKLDDLDAAILNQLKESKCGMILLNENFSIVETTHKTKNQNIPLTIDGNKQFISIENIIRFEACGNYTYVHLKDLSKPILTSRTLKYYVELLDNENFIRSHHKHMVNLKYTKNLSEDNSIDLVDGTLVPVSRRKLYSVKKALLNCE